MKLFSVEEANRTLPLVSRIVGDIVTQYAVWRDRVQQFDVLQASVNAEHPEPRAVELQAELDALAREIDGYVRELTALGVEFKGFDMGLVDFPGELNGRPVYLCWRLGEPAVEHWHEREAGFAGRQRLVSEAVS
ncbi:MAG TPA: DUF2203 domain-containing protein [Gemmatimonadaceae bacterium]|jgi:hypothetical protein|nr:DUF2203 domain-containing protein [Gemmatimonadaceae bacterium]